MNYSELEKELLRLDFSFLSKVREPLLEKLLANRRQQRLLKKNNRLYQKKLSDNELNEIAAAGLNQPAKKDSQKGVLNGKD